MSQPAKPVPTPPPADVTARATTEARRAAMRQAMFAKFKPNPAPARRNPCGCEVYQSCPQCVNEPMRAEVAPAIEGVFVYGREAAGLRGVRF